MTNESVLQKLINVIRKEKEAISLELWEKQKFIGYFSAFGFVVDRIIEMQKDLQNERIESISVDMEHEIKAAYSLGYENGQKFITDKIKLLIDVMDDAPLPDDAAVEYYNKTFVKK